MPEQMGLLILKKIQVTQKPMWFALTIPKRQTSGRLKMRKRTSVVGYAHIYNDQFHGPVPLRVP